MARGLAIQLWRRNEDLAEACRQHPFVLGLGAGSLSRSRFQGYVGQDAYFLEAFVRAYALGLARAPDRYGLRVLAGMLQGALEELELHRRYAERWGVDLAEVVPAAATRNYTAFLLATAALGGTDATCAAMAPCMRLYAYLGQSLAGAFPGAAHDYAEWISTYAAPGFNDLARSLEDLLDRYAEDGPHIRAAYRRAMELELAFFNAAMA
jgi:thiaminase/transcriptional activator TenA